MRVRLVIPTILVLVASNVATVSRAHADERAACVDAHTKGQVLRNRGKWLEASQSFRVCSSPRCPSPVTLDCTRWEQELRALVPSVVVVAQAPDGTDAVDAKLTIDGVTYGDRVPATAIKLDPGEHVVRLESSRFSAAEERIVVREREQDRRIVLRLSGGTSKPEPSSATPAPTPAPRPPSSPTSPALGIVLVSVGAVALGTGVTFGVMGKAREDDLASQPCGKSGTCAPADVDVVRRDYLIAGIASGVGAAVIALGIWQLLSRNGDTPRAGGASQLPLRFTF